MPIVYVCVLRSYSLEHVQLKEGEKNLFALSS